MVLLLLVYYTMVVRLCKPLWWNYVKVFGSFPEVICKWWWCGYVKFCGF